MKSPDTLVLHVIQKQYSLKNMARFDLPELGIKCEPENSPWLPLALGCLIYAFKGLKLYLW